jgi:DMSO/TMAO reductase YedYZ molybdopterin-dependent catalytic subunit
MQNKERESDRRQFLKLAGIGALGAWTAGCGWRGEPLVDLLQWWWNPNELLQKALTTPKRGAKLYPPGSETATFPTYYISDAIPMTDTATWRLEIGGMVSQPLSLSLDDLLKMPMTTTRVRHYCIEGWTGVAEWSGVQLSHLAELVGVDPAVKYVDFRSFDNGYWSSWDRETALHPQTLIAVGMNGTLLDPGHGAPARLYSSLKYGYKAVKYLTEINFLSHRTGGYWEDQGYDWYAGL